MQQLGINDLKEEERTRCEIWTRVMGYHRPVAAWNPGKQAEHAQRRFFRETLPRQHGDGADTP
jgi:hypothetical protein